MPLYYGPFKGRTATYVVAASDAPAHVKAQADYVCDGVADNVEIQAAIDALSSFIPGSGFAVGGGTVKLSEGTFYISDSIDFKGMVVTLEGAGIRSSLLYLNNNINKDMFVSTTVGAYNLITLRDFFCHGNLENNASGWLLNTANMYMLLVENCRFTRGASGCIWGKPPSEACTFRSVSADYSPLGFYLEGVQWYDFYDCSATQNSSAGFLFSGSKDCLLVGCTSDQATGTDIRPSALSFYNSSRITAIHCRAFGDPTTPKLLRGFHINCDSGIQEFIHLYSCEVHNVDLASGWAYCIDNVAGNSTRGIVLENCLHTGKAQVGLRTQLGAAILQSRVVGCGFAEAGIPVSHAAPANAAGLSFEDNYGYVTENSGAAEGTGAQQLVPHGLAFTPTRQQIALIAGSATANPFHSADPDGTNIKVTAASGQAWYWATVG